MFKFIVKRLLLSVVIFFFAMFIIYTLMYLLPTSYVEKVARERHAAISKRIGSNKTYEQVLTDMKQEYGMDDNIVNGYFKWLGKAVQGKFGNSWISDVPCTTRFSESIWESFWLGLVTFILEIIIAIPLGVIAARKQYSMTDYTVTVISLIGISLPTFFVASLLRLVFSIHLGWLPFGGTETRNVIQGVTPQFTILMDKITCYILPAMTLTIVSIGGLMRYTRTNMLEVLNSDYIRTARAKGLPESKVIGHHAFRNTLIPIVTILGGSLPGLFSGALITETIFSVDGIGAKSYESMTQGDIPFTMFYLAFMSILTLLGNIIADVLYAAVDPRVRVN